MNRDISVGWHTLRDGSMRYWNGVTWTLQSPPPGTDGPAVKVHHKHWWQRK
jgi:hypothetical protein